MEDNFILDGERIDTVNKNIRLIQKKNGLTFGTDAYLLSAFIRPSKYQKAAELGSGTGIISLLLAASDKLSKIYAMEIQKEFAELCQRNIMLNGLCEKVVSVCADVRHLRPEEFNGEFDIVFSNPPYMKSNSGKRNEHDEKFIARHEVCGDIRDFCVSASTLLKFGGSFYCVYRPDRMADLFAAMRQNKLEPKRMIFVHADSDTPPSMLLVEAKKGGACGLDILPPLFLHKPTGDKSGKRELTAKAQKVYDSCSFEHFGKG